MKQVLGFAMALCFGSFAVMAQTQTPTPSPLPTATADPMYLQFGAAQAEYLATAQALENQGGLTTDGTQIYSGSTPLLPSFQSSAFISTIGYMKWIISSNATREVFGPFAPIVQHFRIFFLLALPWLAFYFIQRVITVVIRIIIWVFNFVVRVVRLAFDFARLLIPWL